MSYESDRDVRFTKRGLWIWIARRFKPGQQVIRWNYWLCAWTFVTIEKLTDYDTADLLCPGGFDFESLYRLRPMWFRFTPSYWIWKRRE